MNRLIGRLQGDDPTAVEIVHLLLTLAFAITLGWDSRELLWSMWTTCFAQTSLIVIFSAIGPAPDAIDPRRPSSLGSPQTTVKPLSSRIKSFFGILAFLGGLAGLFLLSFAAALNDRFPLPESRDSPLQLGAAILRNYGLLGLLSFLTSLPSSLRWRHDPHKKTNEKPLLIRMFISLFILGALDSVGAPDWAAYVAITVAFFPWGPLLSRAGFRSGRGSRA